MKNNITIITLSIARWKEYKKIRLESLQEEQSAFGTSAAQAVLASNEEWIQILQNAENEYKDILFFAEHCGSLVGIMGAYYNKSAESQDCGYLHGIYVNKKYRDKGIGNKLMKKVIERLKMNHGLKKIKLCVNKQQKSAIRLYEKLGFKVVDTQIILL